MIFGNGLLAKTFSTSFHDDEDVLVFASGVSNSKETSQDAFRRERTLLDMALAQRKLILYFSTCSVNDPELFHTPYVQHKLAMERLISDARRFCIFRLPQVVGNTPNPHTLTNFLYRQIKGQLPFYILKRAKRNLIDVCDAAKIVTHLVTTKRAEGVITNVACPYSVDIAELVCTFENVLGIQAVCDTIDAGASYEIETVLSTKIAKEVGVIFDPQYVKNLIRKYYAK